MEYGCIGEHLSHSFSEEIHRKIGDYKYELREIPPDGLDRFMKEKDFRGINVTIPYKTAVMPYLDEIDPQALKIGCVNTVVNRNGILSGFNTDFDGMKALIEKIGLELENKKILILGTGGTSKTAFAVAEALGAAKITKAGRKKSEFNIDYSEAYRNYTDTEIIINTTPCGMFPDTDAVPADIEKFPKLSGVCDAIYNPLHSKLVTQALNKGIKAGGGLYMLAAQAVFAAEKFFGASEGKAAADRIYREILREKENIVLVGMPGCGKTSIGRKLSEILDKRFLDTDKEIENKCGKTPAEIIRTDGIKEFRRAEAEIIKEISSSTGCVIATGGGAVLDSANIRFLRANGKIIFIDRPVEQIQPTDDRPLSSDRSALYKLYSERYGIYSSCCDAAVDNSSSEEAAVNKITEYLNGAEK